MSVYRTLAAPAGDPPSAVVRWIVRALFLRRTMWCVGRWQWRALRQCLGGEWVQVGGVLWVTPQAAAEMLASPTPAATSLGLVAVTDREVWP